MKITEVKCKQALSHCGIEDFSYSMNPYIGCYHNCSYCYARFMLRFKPKGTKWGEFVDVKVNFPEALLKQMGVIKPKRVMISSVTDAYQPIERKYKITCESLKILARYHFWISLLTKSDLVLRDIDILKKFDKRSEVGFTVCFDNDEDRKNFEPNSSPIENRFKALKELKKNGIKTFAFIGPLIPGVSDRNLENLFKKLAETRIDYLLVDKLNLKCGNWPFIRKVLEEKYSLKDYKSKYLSKEHYNKIKQQLKELAKKYNLNLNIVCRELIG